MEKAGKREKGIGNSGQRQRASAECRAGGSDAQMLGGSAKPMPEG